jgi:hypothetical protein
MTYVFNKGQRRWGGLTRRHPLTHRVVSALIAISLATLAGCGSMRLQDKTQVVKNADPTDTSTAASSNVEGAAQTKAHVAIVLDFYDPYTDIMNKLKLDYPFTQSVRLELMSEYIKVYEIDEENNDIAYPTFYSLFQDQDNDGQADIHKYTEVYINSQTKSDIDLLDKSLRRVLLQYIANGGTLYVTEWSFQFVEPDIDQYI